MTRHSAGPSSFSLAVPYRCDKSNDLCRRPSRLAEQDVQCLRTGGHCRRRVPSTQRRSDGSRPRIRASRLPVPDDRRSKGLRRACGSCRPRPLRHATRPGRDEEHKSVSPRDPSRPPSLRAAPETDRREPTWKLAASRGQTSARRQSSASMDRLGPRIVEHGPTPTVAGTLDWATCTMADVQSARSGSRSLSLWSCARSRPQTFLRPEHRNRRLAAFHPAHTFDWRIGPQPSTPSPKSAETWKQPPVPLAHWARIAHRCDRWGDL